MPYPYSYTTFDDATFKNFTYYIHEQVVPLKVWVINHGMNTTDLIFNVYDGNDVSQIVTSKFVDENTVELYFTEEIIGKAILMSPGVGEGQESSPIEKPVRKWKVFV